MKQPLISILGLVATTTALAQSDNQPNVILLVADDLGYGDLSCYGATRVSTPSVDKLAANGVRFTNAHACAATSTPSRYSLLTGEYCIRNANSDVAAGNAAMIIQPDQYTIADLFKDNGYTTAAIGKWHLGIGSTTGQQNWNGKLDQSLADIGFDYSYIMAATADRVPCVWIENDSVANYDPSAPIEVSYIQNFDTGPTLLNYKGELLVASSHGHDQSVINGIGRIGYMRGGGNAIWKDEHLADTIAQKAIDFITKNRENPFFLYLCTNDIHVPRWPNERFRGKNKMGLRGDVIKQFDWTVGVVIDALQKLGLEDNTIVILTSDNGPVLDDGYQDYAEELLGNHSPSGNRRGTKYSAYDGGSIVPFIVSWGKHTPQGKTSNALVSQIDCFASLAQLIEAPLPKNAAPDSRNFIKTWLGLSDKSAPYAIAMAQNRTLNICTDKWKYIEPSDGPERLSWNTKIETGYKEVPQLFRQGKDLKEEHNLAKRYKNVVRKLQKILDAVKANN